MSHSVRSTYILCRTYILLVVLFPAFTLADDDKIDDAEWQVVVEDSESYRIGLQRLRAFSEIHPHLEKESNSSVLVDECPMLSRQCVRYLQNNRAAAIAAVPDNPDYWRSYEALLEVTPLARVAEDLEPYDVSLRLRQNLIKATGFWGKRELLINGTLDVRDLHFQVQAHRRLHAESNFLIDKMIYLATVGISLPAINVFMAQHATVPLDGAETKLLEEMLRPLSLEEHSYRRALQGEYQFALNRSDEFPEIDEVYLDDIRQIYAYVAGRSELSWSDYWREGLDVWADVPLYISENWLPSWAAYTSNTRYVDVTLHLLRALREVYEGRASPGIPGHAPPPRWYWQWRVGDEELCLEPGDIHHSLGQGHTICLQYLLE